LRLNWLSAPWRPSRKYLDQPDGHALSYFWISDVGEPSARGIEIDAEYGFRPKANFMVQWNKDGNSV
jgi:hypothetical protein